MKWRNHTSHYTQATIANGYYFYDRILTDYNNQYAHIGTRAQADIRQALSELYVPNSNATILTSIWKTERSKEIAALKKFFGQTIDIDMENPAFGKELVEAYNVVLQFKNSYERFKALMLQGTKNGFVEKGTTAYFGNGFSHVWNSGGREKCVRTIQENIQSGQDLTTAITQGLKENQEELYREALTYMFTGADVENTIKNMELSETEKAQYKQAHQDFVNLINSSAGNHLVQQFIQLYNIQGISKEIERVLNEEGEDIDEKKLINDILNFASSRVTMRSDAANVAGLAQERLATAAAQEALNSLSQLNGSKSKVVNTGGAGKSTTDITMVVTLDDSQYQQIDKALDQRLQEISKSNTKEGAIKGFTQFGQDIEGLSDSLVIYTNNKLYAIGKTFGGYSAGESRNLKGFLGQLPISLDINTFLNAILNCGHGSIGGDNGEQLSKGLAQLIAYFLFDDYSTIGKSVAEQSSGGANAIHLMSLNNIYVPLSIFLEQMDKAIQMLVKPSGAIRVTLNIPEVPQLYRAREYNESWKDDPTVDNPIHVVQHWNNQRKVALSAASQIKITYHFFQGVQDIMRTIFGG